MSWYSRFARSYRDEIGLLAPITQCCLIRLSTLDRLLKLYTDDVTLSEKLRRSLANETVQPLLTDKHLKAVDRRLVIVLEAIYKCISQAGSHYATVIEDDGFWWLKWLKSNSGVFIQCVCFVLNALHNMGAFQQCPPVLCRYIIHYITKQCPLSSVL